jgi:hypothetical protein
MPRDRSDSPPRGRDRRGKDSRDGDSEDDDGDRDRKGSRGGDKDRDKDKGGEMVRVSQSQDVHDVETRRNLKFSSFVKSKLSFGFKHLKASHVPMMGEQARGFALRFEKVEGWEFPKQVRRELMAASERESFDIQVHLSLSMFHLNSSSFFGSTWTGPPVSIGDSLEEGKNIDFDYTDIVYMISRITDPSCVAVVEIVASKYDRRRNVVTAQFGCGWTMINFFTKPDPPDIAEGHENAHLLSRAVFIGSPRDLIVNNNIDTLAARLKEIDGCALSFTLYSHRKLLKAQKLVAENEAIGRFDVVPGLAEKSTIPPEATRERMVACIGDEEIISKTNGVLCIPVAPELAPAIVVKISNAQVLLPNRNKLERRMLDSFARKLVASKEAPKIVSRTLKVGLHNGHTVVGGHWQSFPLLEDEEDHEMLRVDTDTPANRGTPDSIGALWCLFVLLVTWLLLVDCNLVFACFLLVVACCLLRFRLMLGAGCLFFVAVA